MRKHTDISNITAFMKAMGESVRSAARIYFTGGASAILHDWRQSTLDIDLTASSPEPAGFFEALAKLKESLNLNIELAAPHQFIPQLPGWEARSAFIARHGVLDFYHYDFYSQALAKIERNHQRDQLDVAAMLERQLINRVRLQALFTEIEPRLIRYPAINANEFAARVNAICQTPKR